MHAEEKRAAELEEQLHMRDWAALERLSGMWRAGRLSDGQALKILELILPDAAAEGGMRAGRGLAMGECRIGEGEKGK